MAATIRLGPKFKNMSYDGVDNWAQCDRCSKWRIPGRKFSDSDLFSCYLLYPWVGVNSVNGKWKGGCNTEPHPEDISYHRRFAFDTAEKECLTNRKVCNSIERLLQKLLRHDLVTKKQELLDKIKACDSCAAVAEMVCSHL
jgi:hypothetical protein